MLIRRVHIDRFGKLKDKSLEFEEDLNIIHGGNETGKSTLQNFILSSFYGARTTKKNGLENVRKKYIPHNKDYTFGTMEIEQEGKSIVIERKISRTRKDDLYRAYDKETFDQVNLPENLGKELFHLEYEEFVKTLYVNQGGGRFLSEKDEGLTTRLTNLLETGDEDVSYTKAIERTDQEIKAIKGLRKNGRLDEIYAELGTLYGELGESRRIEVENRESELKLKTLSRKKEENERMKRDLHDLKDKIYLFNVKDEFLRIRKSLEDLEKLKNERVESFRSVSDKDLKALRQSEKDILLVEEDIGELEEKLESLGRDILQLSLILEDFAGFNDLSREDVLRMVSLQGEELLLEEKLKHFNPGSAMNENLFLRRQELKKILQKYEMHLIKLKKREYLSSILPTLLIASGILAYVLQKNFILSLTVIALSIPVYFLLSSFEKSRIRWHLNRSDEYEEKIGILSKDLGMDYGELLRSKKLIESMPEDREKEKLVGQYERIRAYKESVFSVTQTNSVESLIKREGEYRRLLERNLDLKRELDRTDVLLKGKHELRERKTSAYEKELTVVGYDKDKDELMDYLEYYESQALRMKDLYLKEEALKYSLKGIIGDRDEEEIRKELNTLEELGISDGIDFKGLEEKERNLNEEEIRIIEETNNLKLKLNGTSYKETLLIEDSVLLLQNEEKDLLKRYEVLCLTRDIMKESYDNLRHDFSSDLNDRVTGIYEAITGSNRTIKVNELYAMNYKEEGILLNEEFLSTGSLEQLYLSLRLAMAEIMFPEGKVPLFLDEPFVSYDQERLERVLRYLLSKKDRYQIFLFTCHEREMEFLRNNASVITLDQA